jgi:hypothetical protein
LGGSGPVPGSEAAADSFIKKLPSASHFNFYICRKAGLTWGDRTDPPRTENLLFFIFFIKSPIIYILKNTLCAVKKEEKNG